MSDEPKLQRVSPFRRVGRGLGASSFGQAATVLSRLLEVPVVITFWGVSPYGHWLILNVVPTLLTASDMGLGTVAARNMARQVNEEHLDQACDSFRTAFWVSAFMSVVLGAAAMILLSSGLARDWMGLGGVAPSVVLWVTLVLSLRTVVQLAARVLQAGLTCVGRYPRAMLYTGITNLGSLLIFYTVLVAGGGMIMAAASQLLASILGYVAMYRSMRNHADWLTTGAPRIRRSALREMWRPSLASCLISLSRSVNYSAPRLVIGSVMGPAAVAIFSAHRQLARFINFMLLFSSPFQAELSLINRKDHEEFSSFARHVVQIFVWVSIGSLVAVILAGMLFFDHWVHGKFALIPSLFGLLILTTLLETIGSVALLPAFAVNAHTGVVKVFMIANGIAFLVAVPLSYLFGMDGMAMALVAIDASVCIASCRLYARLIGEGGGRAVFDAFRPPIWIARAVVTAARA